MARYVNAAGTKSLSEEKYRQLGSPSGYSAFDEGRTVSLRSGQTLTGDAASKYGSDFSGTVKASDGSTVTLSGGRAQLPQTITSNQLSQQQEIRLPQYPAPSSLSQNALTSVSGLGQVQAPQGQIQPGQATQDYIKNLLKADKGRESGESIYNRTVEESGLQQAQQRVSQYQSQLNAITASAQAQQLSLEGQGRGQTGAFVGGEQARINREAAIQALPVAAQLSAAQGDLQAAQSHLDTLFRIRSEDAKRDYDFKKEVYGVIYDYANKQEQRQLDLLDKQADRQYKEREETTQYLRTLSEFATNNGASNLAVQLAQLDPNSPNYAREVQRIAAKMPPDLLRQAQIANYYETTGGGSGGGAGGDLSGLSQAVVENPSLFYNFTPTQRANIIRELKEGGYDISGLQNVKLSAGQQDDIAQMNTVSGLIDEVLDLNSDGSLKGIGSFGRGTLYSAGAQLGLGSEEGKQVRATIGNIKGTIAKLRGGTSFTANEEKLLNTYTPSINDNPDVAVTKLNLLKSFISKKNSDLLSTARLNPTGGLIKSSKTAGTLEALRAKYKY